MHNALWRRARNEHARNRAIVSVFLKFIIQYNTVQDEIKWNKVDRSRSYRRVQSYSVVGTWPSAVARVIAKKNKYMYTYWAVVGGPTASNTHNGSAQGDKG